MQADFSLPSFAKINWTLRVIGRRSDGYHELFTVFQTISLHDTLTFSESDMLELTCDDPSVPVDSRNLISKAASYLRAQYGVSKGAAIHLEKRIPSPGGLGGGSSNAAVALIGLTGLWEIDADKAEIQQIAAELGSDVPFFLDGGTANGTGRGELIEPVNDICAENLLVVTPDIAVSTAAAFAKLDATTLTTEAANNILTVCRKDAGTFDPLRSVLINDFEPSVFAAHPEIKRVRDTLLDLGAVNAAMSGSGASVFAIFDNTETRQAAEKALEHESTWRKFAVTTVSRSQYRESLGIASRF